MSAGAEGPVVLVVDDEESIRDVVANVARRAIPHARILTAGDALRAEEILRETDVRGVLTDLRMPGPSGLELLQQVAAAFPGTRRALMTGFQEEVIDGVELDQLGLVGILRKPFRTAELAKLLEQLAG